MNIKKQTSVAKALEKKGMKIATWAKSKKLSQKDIYLIRNIARDQILGKRGRAKELKELLVKEGLLREVA